MLLTKNVLLKSLIFCFVKPKVDETFPKITLLTRKSGYHIHDISYGPRLGIHPGTGGSRDSRRNGACLNRIVEPLFADEPCPID